MGRYISTTIRPIAPPITSISTGPNRRVSHSISRAVSSSWNSAERVSISPRLPARSPTASMRCATGVASPQAASVAVKGWPSRTRSIASCRLARSVGDSSPETMRSAPTAGMPPDSSMPSVR